ncbi:MAG: tetratricopeptide repeat protein, partial [Candidatus Binataceae bacterium]
MEAKETGDKETPEVAPAAEPTARAPSPYRPLFAAIGGGDWRIGAALAAILLTTAIVFARSLGNQFVLDDHDQIVGNPYLGDWSFIWKSLTRSSAWFMHPLPLLAASYYRPLQNIWFALNYHLFGFHPAGWHGAMILLHLAVVWLVFRVATRLCGDPWAGLGAAALFALMPIHAEAVAWAAAIAAPLAAAFQLGAFECYLRSFPSPAVSAGEGSHARDAAASGSERPLAASAEDGAGEGSGRRWFLPLSLALFGGALLSYDAAVAFPGLVAAHAYLMEPDRPHRSNRSYVTAARNAIAAAWPYLLELAAYFAIRFGVLGFVAGRPDPTNRVTAYEALLTVPAAITNYLLLIAAPWLPGPAHSLTIAHWIASPRFLLPLAGLGALAYAGLKSIARHPHRRLYLFCAAWFLIALAPMLYLPGLFRESFIHDRYLYLPSVGICVIAADWAAVYARGGERRTMAVWIAAAAMALAYVPMLFIAQGYWRDEPAALSRCIEEEPSEGTWQFRMGLALAARDDYRGAIAALQTANRIDPGDPADLHEMALVYEALHERKAAERVLATRIGRIRGPGSGDYAELALAAAAAGDKPGAAASLD